MYAHTCVVCVVIFVTFLFRVFAYCLGSCGGKQIMSLPVV